MCSCRPAEIQWVKALDNIGNYPLTQVAYPYIASDTTFEAFQCLFYFSVREIEARVANGIYTEHITDEFLHNSSIHAPDFASGKAETIPWLDPNSNYDLVFQPPFAKGPPNLNSTFTVQQESYEIVGSEFVHLISGNISVISSSGFQGPDLLLLLWMSSNVTRAMDNIAIYMTNSLRANDSALLANGTQAQGNVPVIAPQQAVLGKVWVQEQFVTVRWAYLAMPLSLILSVTVFLSATIVRTARARIGVWKSSPLALLFHGLIDRDELFSGVMAASRFDTADAMKDAGAGIRASLIGSGHDGEFSVYRA